MKSSTATFQTLLLQAKLEDVKKLYADQIKDLEAMKVTRPAKPVAAEKVRFDTDQCLNVDAKRVEHNNHGVNLQPAEPAAAPAPAPEAAKA